VGGNKIVIIATKITVGHTIPSMCVFWVITPYTLVGGNKCNRGANYRHLQCTIFVAKTGIQWWRYIPTGLPDCTVSYPGRP